MAQHEIVDKDFLLFGCAGKLIECYMESLLLAVLWGECDIRLHLRLETVALLQS